MEKAQLKSYISLMFVVCFTFVVALFTAGCNHEHSSSNLELVQEQAATCTTDGHKAYYKCKDCDKIFEDENGKTETTLEDVVVKAHHTTVFHEAKRATCITEGNKEYWQCTACGKKFTSESATTEVVGSVVTEPTGEHKLTSVSEKPAKCTEPGVKQHWECEDCHTKFFKNENDGYNEITDENALVINAKGHTFGDLIKTDATCIEEGTKAHYHCSVCLQNYADNEGKEEIKDIVLHKLPHQFGEETAEVKATCVKKGTKAHFKCSSCEHLFTKTGEGESAVYTQVTEESLVIPIDTNAHAYKHVDEISSTCTTHGTAEHYTCTNEGCNKLFTKTGEGESAAYEVVENAETLKLELAAHTYAGVDKKDATCTEDGYKAHFKCNNEGCNKLFTRTGEGESAVYAEIKESELVIKAGHTMVGDICSVCHYGAVAVVNNTYYKTLTDAINAAASGATITLTDDITINSYISINKSLTIDFGGYTISSKNTVNLSTIDFNKTEASENGTGKINGHGFDIGETTGEGVVVTFRNGKLVTDKWGVWVENKATFNVEKGFEILSSILDERLDSANAITVVTGATLNLYGKAETTFGPTISGNGKEGWGDVTINIYEGAVVTSGNDVAVYMPNTNTLNITNATITGTTAVYVKCGTTTISGGTLIATGDKKDYVINNNGGDATGAALVIDVCCGYPGGNPTVVIGNGCVFQVKLGEGVESAADFISYYHNKGDADHKAIITNNSNFGVVTYEYDTTTGKATKVTTSESGNDENPTQGGTTQGGESQGGN